MITDVCVLYTTCECGRHERIAGGKVSKEGRQTVFFTAVDLMNEPLRDEAYDVKEP